MPDPAAWVELTTSPRERFGTTCHDGTIARALKHLGRPTEFTFLDRSARGLLLHVHVVPGAAKTGIAGIHDQRLKVRVHAPPAGGAANRELVRFLSALFGVAPSSLEIVRGASDRRKVVRLPLDVDVTAGLRDPALRDASRD